ncbi:hypothetical protein CROQUDRAFT_656279 [Cronartium quercuum f. sp. fusiforme G11]|uniref:DNA ligase n=1 Tax=Cronartium quercuum f. sp. fusiforme G11 TaxID=708437 RepID=A0A9P6TCG9_9BASI|nr:hypothetical protein CROQUDRAFT_656279 [Cronartium quercuum f. sp. fusiforme G11]
MEKVDILQPIGPSPSFGILCQLFRSIENYVPKPKYPAHRYRRACLTQFFHKWTQLVGKDVYPCLRLLLPHHDKERSTFWLKELALTRLYCDALDLNKQSPNVQQVLHWKRPANYHSHDAAGNFATALLGLIESRCATNSTTLTVDQLNEQLDILATARSDTDRLPVVKTLLDSVTPSDHKWIIRIILKDLHLSINESNLLPIIHEQALLMFNACSDIKQVCHTLHSPNLILGSEQSQVSIFHVFKPMLANRNRKDLKAIAKLMLSGNQDEFYIDEKLDGERIQMHKQGDQYRYWSRNGKDYTYLYGAEPTMGCLTPWIHCAFSGLVDEVILDGEMLVWDPLIERTQPFGSLKTFASRPTRDPDQPRAMFRVFDILYLKAKAASRGVSFLQKPLHARRGVLEGGQVFKPVKTRLELCYYEVGHTAKDINRCFLKILEERGEGLVVKQRDSKYYLGSRKDDWVKVKPDYMDELGETFDVMVVGGYWGNGKRGGRFGSFMCALVDEDLDRDERDRPGIRYKTFCKAGIGLNSDETEQIMRKVEGKWHEWDRRDPKTRPFWLDVGTSDQPETPDVWWNPQDSFVLTIKAAEIVQSRPFGCGMSLRFPRSIRFDLERTARDCWTYNELLYASKQSISQKRSGKDRSVQTKRRKTGNSRAQNTTGVRLSTPEDEGKIFYGLEFWIIQGCEDTAESKQELEIFVNSNGGKITQTIPRGEKKICVSLAKNFPNAHKVVKQGLDLVHPLWITESVSAQKCIPFFNENCERYLVHTSDNTQTMLKYGFVDAFKAAEEDKSGEAHERLGGGSETRNRNVDVREKEVGLHSDSEEDSEERASSVGEDAHDEYEAECEKGNYFAVEVDATCSNLITATSSAQLQEKARDPTPEASDSPDGIFCNLYIYLDYNPSMAKKSSGGSQGAEHQDAQFPKIRRLIEKHGGTIVTEIVDPRLTHVVLGSDTSRFEELMRLTSKPRRRRMVTTAWVLKSVEAHQALFEADFPPP